MATGCGAWRGTFGCERAWKNPSVMVGEVDVDEGAETAEAGTAIGKRSESDRESGRNGGDPERLPGTEEDMGL